MAEKAACPKCDSYTSAIWRSASDGEPCPYCGESLNGVLSAQYGVPIPFGILPFEVEQYVESYRAVMSGAAPSA